MRFLLPDLVFHAGALRGGLAVDLDGGVVPAEGIAGERLTGKALLPGFVNAHSHAFQRGLRGHVQHADGPDSFWTWRERMYHLANALDPDGIEAVSALAFLEMLRAGFTSVGEFHYLHHQPDGTPYADPDELARRVLAAAASVGIRVRLLRVAYARAGFGSAANPLQRRFIDRSPDDVLAACERLGAGLAPHSVRACPADWLRAFAGFPGVVHAHVDEQPAEIEASLREHGARPLRVFGELVGPRFSAVHFTHADADERALLAERGANVVVCPTTELDLGDGFFDPRGVARMSVGTDSHAQIDPFAEVRALELHARALTGRRNVLPHAGADGLAARLVEIGTDASCLALDTRGDWIAVDVGDVALAGARLLPAIVFAGARVTDTWVGGRRVIAGGRHPGERAIVERAEAALRATGI
ncbi:MAG: formimidoylglutamate deiminase [Myxococcota bacterium]